MSGRVLQAPITYFYRQHSQRKGIRIVVDTTEDFDWEPKELEPKGQVLQGQFEMLEALFACCQCAGEPSILRTLNSILIGYCW